MKKIILSNILLLCSYCVFSQQNNSHIENGSFNKNYLLTEAGQSLTKSSKQYYTGLAVTIGGFMLASTTNDRGPKIAGSAMVLVGTVIQIISHRHIGKAGELLVESTFASAHEVDLPQINPTQGMPKAGIYLPINKTFSKKKK